MEKKSYNPKYPVQTLEKALDIIEIFFKESDSRGLGISDLDKKLNMGKSTIHRILDTLAAYNYVEKCEGNTRYRLGWKLYEIGNVVPRHRNIFQCDYGILQELCNLYKETVNLGVRVDSDVITIAKFEPATTLMANLQIGSREPLYATAMGKMLISQFDRTKILEILGEEKFKSYTPNTITNLDDLLVELEKIKKQGYSIDVEESCLGLCCIAMPIQNYKKEIVSAVSVSGPSVRLNFNKIMDVKEGLAEATGLLSGYLGYKDAI
ncbi:MAG: IclR family transcriptional regulator [Peptococcaceae bacterium]